MDRDADPVLTRAVVVDTSFIYAMGGPENEKYETVSTYTTTTGTTFYVPPRVYEECRVREADDLEVVPQLHQGTSDGWLQFCEALDYSVRLRDGMRVATVMDRVREKMARLRDGAEDHVEKTDTALAGYAVQLLAEGNEKVTIAMRDRTAEAAIMAVFADTVYSNCISVSSPNEIFEFVSDDISSI